MARYGPPDDPNNYSDEEPTAYASSYGNYGGYDQQPGQAGPPPEPEVPWYRKPAALVAFGAIIALMLALIVWLVISLMSGSSSSTNTTTTTTTPTTASASTGRADANGHRDDHAAVHFHRDHDRPDHYDVGRDQHVDQHEYEHKHRHGLAAGEPADTANSSDSADPAARGIAAQPVSGRGRRIGDHAPRRCAPRPGTPAW